MKDRISLIFTGDCALTGCAESIPGKSYDVVIDQELQALFAKSDLNVINLETPLTRSKDKILKTGPHLKAHPDSVKLLKDLHVNLACLSNNHIRDFDDRGVQDTITTCLSNNISVVGAGSNLGEAAEPLVLDVKGKKIAFLNFSESEFNYATEQRAGSNPDDPIHIWRTFESVKGKADFIIAIMHGGREMLPYPTPGQMTLFRFVADLGAHTVIGHHSHVIGGYEIYNGKPILYSLGNFLFDEPDNGPEWYTGAVLQLILDKGGWCDVIFHQILLNGKHLKVLANQKVGLSNSQNSFMICINKDLVFYQWNKLIADQANTSIKNIIDLGLIKRILIKLKLIRVKISNYKKLLSTLNRLQCRTHREYYSETINLFLKQRK